MRQYRFRTILWAALAVCAAHPAFAGVADYRYHAPLTVVGAAEGVSLSNFPVLVRISPARIAGFAYAQLASPQDGADLRFTDVDGHFVNHDIDTWNTNGESLVWVTVPTLAPGSSVIMRWGNPAPAEANNPAAVWTNAGYLQVWHFSSGVTTDATGRRLSLMLSGDEMVASSSDLLGGCYTNAAPDNTKAYIDVPSHDALLADPRIRTLTGWFRPNEVFAGSRNGVWMTFFSNKHANSADGFNLCFFNNNLFLYGNGQSSRVERWNDTMLPAGMWAMVGARFAATEDDEIAGTVFLQGAVYKTASLTAGISRTTGTVAMGNFGGRPSVYGNAPFHGDMDEFRVHGGALPAAWIREEYATVVTDGYLSYGGVEEYVPPYVALLRSSESDTLPPEFGTPNAVFTDSAQAVAAVVAAKAAGAETSTLYVAPGTYHTSVPLRATNDVSIVGLGAAAAATFAGPPKASTEWNFRVMTFSGGGLLANVTFRGNTRGGFDADDGGNTGTWNAPCRFGGTLYLSGDVADVRATVASNIVVREGNNGRWNYNEFIGTVAVMGTATLTDSVVEDNQSTGWGAGVYADGNALMRRCILRRNHVKYPGSTQRCHGGGAGLSGAARMVDCLVADNESDMEGGGVWLNLSDASGGLYHCTVAGNTATNAPGVNVNRNAGKIVNSLVAGNGDGTLADLGTTFSSTLSSFSVATSCLGTQPGEAFANVTGCLVADPVFRNAAGGDYTLAGGSPCIDAAAAVTPITEFGPTTSWIALNGVPHCHDDSANTFAGLPDIGCYESTIWANMPTVLMFR